MKYNLPPPEVETPISGYYKKVHYLIFRAIYVAYE